MSALIPRLCIIRDFISLIAFGCKLLQSVLRSRADTGLGLAEAKALVDGAPKTLKEAAAKEEAEEIKAKLAEVGATVELQ